MKLGYCPVANASGVFLCHGIGPDCRLFRKCKAQLEEYRLHLGKILKPERRDKRGCYTRHYIASPQQEGIHIFLFTVDYLCILRTHHRAASAENASLLDNLRLVIPDFYGLDRAFPQALVTVLTPGFLELEILFHKYGLLYSTEAAAPA